MYPRTLASASGEQLADVVEHAGVRGRVRARRATDRRLVDVDDLVELLDALDRLVPARAAASTCRSSASATGSRMSLTSVLLPEPRHAGDGDEAAERDVDVDVAQVVLARALDREPLVARACAAAAGTGIDCLPGRGTAR